VELGRAWPPAIGACFLAACYSTSPLPLNDPQGARSLLLALEDSRELRIRAYDRPGPIDVALTGETLVTAIFYARSLAELGIRAGRMELEPKTQVQRKLPRGWMEIDELPPGVPRSWRTRPGNDLTSAIDAARFEVSDWAECESYGGCAGGTNLCVTPCGESSVAAPEPPEMPTFPELRARLAGGALGCAPGFADVETSTVYGVHACDVAAPMVSSRCAGQSSAQLLGQSGCNPIGGPCSSASAWSSAIPAGARIIYVLAGRSGGDGSQAAPYGSIRAAMSRASEGAIVALGVGRYRESFSISSGVTVWGACAAATILESDVGSGGSVITSTAPGAKLTNLTVEGGVLVRGAGASMVIDQAAIEGATSTSGAALTVADGAAAVFSGSLARDNANGILAVGGSRVDVRGSAFEDNTEVHVRIEGSTASVSDSILRSFEGESVSCTSATLSCGGVIVDPGGRAAITRTSMFALGGVGVLAGHGGVAQVTDSVIRGTRNGVGGCIPCGVALYAWSGTIAADRVVVDRNSVGLVMIDRAGQPYARLSDIHITRSSTVDDQGQSVQGDGIIIREGALDAQRILIEENAHVGIYMGVPISESGEIRVRLSDLIVRGLNRKDRTDSGVAVLTDGGNLVLSRALIEDNRSSAFHLGGRDEAACGLNQRGQLFEMELSDLTIRRTQLATAGCQPGFGMYVECGVIGSIARVALEDNLEAYHQSTGAMAMSADLPRIKMSDVRVSGPDDGLYVDSGTISLSRASIQVRGRGFTLGNGAGGLVQDLEVTSASGSDAMTWNTPQCPVFNDELGVCIAIRDTATNAHVDRFRCEGDDRAIYLLTDPALLTLKDGSISHARFAFDVGQRQDLSALLENVRIEDVETFVDAH
jgi:hypothetical protein